MGHVNISKGIKNLKHIIPKLQTLILLETCLDVWDLFELAAYLGKAKKLNRLTLCNGFLGPAVVNIAEQLKHMVSLKLLDLANNCLGDYEVQILVDGIKTMSSLDRIDLRGNPDIGWEGRSALGDNLCSTHPQFEEMEIVLEPISDKHVWMYLMGWQNMQNHRKLKEIKESETAALPDCHGCMSQIYNGVTCKQSSMKLSNTAKGEQNHLEEVDSLKQTKPTNDDEKKHNSDSIRSNSPIADTPAESSPVDSRTSSANMQSSNMHNSRNRQETSSLREQSDQVSLLPDSHSITATINPRCMLSPMELLRGISSHNK